MFQLARFDPIHPDYERYPLMAHAQMIEVRLLPGETLVPPCAGSVPSGARAS